MASAIFILYSVSLGHNFLFDEENIILMNPLIRSWKNIPDIFTHSYFYFDTHRAVQWTDYYRPMTSLTFLIDYQFWKADPLGYNLTNVFLQIVSCLLFFRILARLLWNETAAFLAALVYSIHTIHTEAVTYIASRGDVLGSMLMLLSIYFYASGKIKRALVVFLPALLAKESVILLPFYIGVFDWVCIRSPFKSLLKKLSGFILIAAGFILFRKFLCPVPLNPPKEAIEAVLLRVLSMGPPIFEYFRALFAPEAFKFCMEIHFAENFQDPRVWTTATLLVIGASLWIWSAFKRGPVFWGLSVFFAGLAPYAQIIHFYPEWAEHYLYIPAMGLAVILGVLIQKILERGKKAWILLFFAAYLPFCGFLALRTWQRNAVYNDPKIYYTLLAQADTPYAFYGHQNLARIFIEEGKWKDAYAPLKTAEAMEPLSDVTQNLLGHYFYHQKEKEKALVHFQKAYRYSDGDSRHLRSAGAILIELGRYGEAEKNFLDAETISPGLISSYTNLMMVYELLDRPDQAKQWAQKGFTTFSGKPKEKAALHMALARLEYRLGQNEKAREELAVIVKDYPDVYWHADASRFALGQTSQEDFKKILAEQYPNFKTSASSYLLMGLVLTGDLEGAAEFAGSRKEEFLEISKTNPLVKRELDRALKSEKAL